ncbi:molybdopterin-dependent oxidoreductase [Sulfuriferula sp. AH1]|uniref:molybdopterin-dependent oxidoreductase n=1 Tax=Sulfuriferula sp. AH1 TaxID=1985873 RepID=UPI001CB8C5E7|nr:molybdopterin-dependent oxidoreductase [Sulfuriferula sp. AH1]
MSRNGLLHLLIADGNIDEAFIRQHTLGFDELAKVVMTYAPERVEALSGVPAADLKKAAELITRSSMLVSTCLQGVYQSNQATAAAVQVNNINLILGRIGRPGCGLLQMNGQPTAQNTRESGADGDLPGFRNWDNPQHIEQLAEIWNVDPAIIPHWSPLTHALQIFRYCEIGSIRFLWIQATNPAVSLPNLNRVRQILERSGLFVIVQDAFLTETAQFADVVLPAALWGEKTGCFTNVDRTVHISHKAVEPPGEARADLDIKENDWIRLSSRRGQMEAPARIGNIAPGELFVPFHYGYWDNPCRARAANELTIYEWDPVSKEPHYKYAAVKLEKIASPSSLQPESMRVADNEGGANANESFRNPPPPAAHIADYIGLLQESEQRLVKGLNQLAHTHAEEPDIGTLSRLFASWSQNAVQALQPFTEQYGERQAGEPERLDAALLIPRKPGGFNLLRHLHDLWLMVNESLISIDVLEQASKALRDQELEAAIGHIRQQNQRQAVWLWTRIRQAAPQTLVVPS